jgi:hypothetical protein
MQEFQWRVVDEKKQLDDKLFWLYALIDSPLSDFSKLPKDEQKRLKKQSKLMQEYSDVLGERIAAFVAH